MLTNLAKAGGGAYNVVNTLEDVATVFGDILGGLISVSAQKVEIQLPPGAKAITSYRTATDEAGMTTVYVGDVYADAEITVLFKSSPSQGPLRIKGTDMNTLDMIDTIAEPILLTDTNNIPVSLLMAEYREKTIAILTKDLVRVVAATEVVAAVHAIEADDHTGQQEPVDLAAERIGCGACVASCKNASAMLFVSAKAGQLNTLPQGQPEKDRRTLGMVRQMDKEGFGNCSNYYECEAVCPAGVPGAFIAKMNRDYALASVRNAVEATS
jgi:ferredoxin